MARWTDSIPKYWNMLAADMREAGVCTLSGSSIRRLQYAGRSVVIPHTETRVPRIRITGHIARIKTPLLEWQEVTHAWVDLSMADYQCALFAALCRDLADQTPPGIALFGFASTESLQFAFRHAGFKRASSDFTANPRMQQLIQPRQRAGAYELFLRR